MAGRPLKFKSVRKLQEAIDAYFINCDPHMEEVTEYVVARDEDGKHIKDENGMDTLRLVTYQRITKQEPYLITGLALALDTTRSVLLDFESGKYDERNEDELTEDELLDKQQRDLFSNTIKKAKSRCEHYSVKRLEGGNGNVAGTIFNLKNNYKNWVDKSEVNDFGDKTINVVTRGAGSHQDKTPPPEETPDPDED